MGLVVEAARELDDDLLPGYESRCASCGRQKAMEWLVNEIRDFEQCRTFDASLPGDAECGSLFDSLFGQLRLSETMVDVALVKMTQPVEPQCFPSRVYPDVMLPHLQLGDGGTEILKVSDFPNCAFNVYGQGARSRGMMKAPVNPLQAHIYFRPVQPGGDDGLVFMCIHAKAKKDNWTCGDSGTWCWTEDGKLVGMGMAFASIQGENYCCMLPMEDVLSAIEQMMENKNNIRKKGGAAEEY
jgi:hypothetical protein